MDELDENMAKKDELIKQLTALDDGFETLYAKIGEQLAAQKDKYKPQIKRLQELISRVTEKSVSIQAQEARNKKLIEDYFKGQRNEIRRGRKSSKVAYDYYKNMSGANVIQPQFMDHKQ
jgi:phage host-nuclease inhibitor protein Gam